MWWLDRPSPFPRLAAALAVAALAGGCFQPLYGVHSFAGTAAGPYDAAPALRERLSAVEVQAIDAPNGTRESRVGLEIRNALIFDLTGGGGVSPAPTHRLKMNISTQQLSIIVDTGTQRPDVENYGIDITYSLTDVATNKIVVTGRTFSRVSYDVPGQAQRFARARGLRDAENRAAKVIAEQIRSRLASFFVSGA
jgi:LPS-assembly lipoprotein